MQNIPFYILSFQALATLKKYHVGIVPADDTNIISIVIIFLVNLWCLFYKNTTEMEKTHFSGSIAPNLPILYTWNKMSG